MLFVAAIGYGVYYGLMFIIDHMNKQVEDYNVHSQSQSEKLHKEWKKALGGK